MLECLVSLFALPLLAAPQDDAATIAAEKAPLVVRAKRLIVRPGVELQDVAVRVEDGVIVAIGALEDVPEDARIIEGEVVCAGFIDPWSVLAMDPAAAEDQSTSAATRSADGVDPWSNEHVREDALRAGVVAVRTQAGAHARSGGVGAIVRTNDVVVVLPDACVQASVGVTRERRQLDIFERIGEVDRIVSMLDSGKSYRERKLEYEKELAAWEKAVAEKEKELEKDFSKKKKEREKEIEKAQEKGKEHKEERYKEDKKPRAPKYNADDEVMARAANGELPLVVEAHRAEELRRLLSQTEKFARLRLVVAGGTEALAVADELAEREVPVIVLPMPGGYGGYDEYADSDLSLAGELHDAGVRVLLGSGATGAEATRELPLLAALAVGHGFDREAAFAALTTGAAEALDVSDRLGAVELGKDAELLVLDGDPLDTTSRIRFVISGGQVVVEP